MMQIPIGNGYDIHQLAAGRRLILGGVEIPHELGLLGHSDAEQVQPDQIGIKATTNEKLGPVGRKKELQLTLLSCFSRNKL